MSFSKNDLDNIKSRLSLRDELEKKTKLIQKGKDYWCCCPFHEEKTPSCKINDDLGSFYCFGCGAKGDIFTIYTDLYKYTFIEAVKELASKTGIKIEFENFSKSTQDKKIEEILKLASKWFQDNLRKKSGEICNKYLEKRKLNKETVEKFKLGYSFNPESTLYEYLKEKLFSDDELLASNVVKRDKNNKIRDYFYKRLIFPIVNAQEKIVGFGGRSLDGKNPKYINSPESKIFQKRFLLYNLNFAKNYARKKDNLLICEGYMDVISLSQNGINSVVAPLGTALTEEQLKLAWSYSTKPTIMFDGDSAGVRASYKSAIMALPLISAKNFLQFINLPENFDPDKYINEISFNKFIEKLKIPETLVEFIFNQSIKSVSLEKVDEKISYDKYLDDLIESIKDKKIKYFYKNEFKNLFFKKIKFQGSAKQSKNKHLKNNNLELNRKQNLSFFAAAINHYSIRQNLLDELLKSELLNQKEIEFTKELSKEDIVILEKNRLLKYFENSSFEKIIKESTTKQIYELFPYSSHKFDPQESLKEVKKSIKNLNTRLSNLKKINKSLDTFVTNSNQLNWSDLQSINLEVFYDE